jgi:putative membrane protein
MRLRTKTIIAATVMVVFALMAALTAAGLMAGGAIPAGVSGSFGNTAVDPGDGSRPVIKDETVYALLNDDGSLRSAYVVNHIKVPEDGTYVDFGNYEKVESLSEDILPRIEGDRITWELKESYGDFYYQGGLVGAHLPWIFKIEYYLDQNRVEAQDLAGKSGKVEIDLSVTPNESAPSYFRERFAMQIQVPVNLNRAAIISADGATQVIAGSTNTLAYTILPGSSGSYRLVLDARDFEMDSINIGISAVDYSSVLSSGDLADGFRKLSQGMEDWVEGAKAFKSGLVDLSDGVGQLSSGLKDISAGSRELHSGLERYSQGFRQFDDSLDRVSLGSGSIMVGLSELSAGGGSILSGYQRLAQGIQVQLPGEAEKEQLRMLAQYAAIPDSPYYQAGNMAKSLLEQIAGLEQIYQNLSALNDALSQYTQGVAELSEEYKGFDQGISALAQASGELQQGISILADGGKQLSEGLSALDSGMAELNGNVKELPGHAQELVDGGLAIKEGTDAANDAVSEMIGHDDKDEKVVSFVAPEKGMASSVQFVIRTPGIKMPEKEKEVPVNNTVKKSIWQKFIDLFS